MYENYFPFSKTAILYGGIAGGAVLLILIVIVVVCVVLRLRRGGDDNNDIGLFINVLIWKYILKNSLSSLVCL